MLLLISLLPIITFAQSGDPFTGEWEPNGDYYIRSIKIKKTEAGEYKVRVTNRDGEVMTAKGEVSRGSLYADFKEVSNYGEFWVKNKEILVGHSGGSYGSNGEATGYCAGNEEYYFSNSRRSCADVENEYFCIELTPSGEDLSLRHKFQSYYLKNGRAMFYQSSNWISVGDYSKW